MADYVMKPAIEQQLVEPPVDLVYRFTEEYGMPVATPLSFKTLTDRLEAQ